MDFTGKTAIITGAAGAIGKDIALELCKNGAKVFVSDIDQDAVDAVAAEIGAGCLGLGADVTKADQVQRVVEAASDAFDGRVDILVNVAGIIGQGNVEDITEDD